MQSSANEPASGACKARGIPAVCAMTAQARRTRGLLPAASNPGHLRGRSHEPVDAIWEQLRSGLNAVLADLLVDGAQAPSGE